FGSAIGPSRGHACCREQPGAFCQPGVSQPGGTADHEGRLTAWHDRLPVLELNARGQPAGIYQDILERGPVNRVVDVTGDVEVTGAERPRTAGRTLVRRGQEEAGRDGATAC